MFNHIASNLFEELHLDLSWDYYSVNSLSCHHHIQRQPASYHQVLVTLYHLFLLQQAFLPSWCARNRHWRRLFVSSQKRIEHRLDLLRQSCIIVGFLSFANLKVRFTPMAISGDCSTDADENCASVTVKANFLQSPSYHNNTSSSISTVQVVWNLTNTITKSCLGCCLACYVSARGSSAVWHEISGYLIANFIRMTFYNRFWCK